MPRYRNPHSGVKVNPGAGGSIYFIGARNEHGALVAVKVGHTSTLISRRLKALQTGCPFQLEVLKTTAGSRTAEREVHRLLGRPDASIRLGGEWFPPEIMEGAFVQSL